MLTASGPALAQAERPEAAAGETTERATRATAKKKRPKKKARAADAKQAAPPVGTAAEENAVAEPDAWERPPADEEQAPPPPSQKPATRTGDGKHISAALVLGYGFLTDGRKEFGADPYRLVVGIRGGYSFDFQMYAGVFYSYYIGDTNPGSSAGTGLMSVSTANYMLFGLELGYDWWPGQVLVRPSLQVGAALALIDSPNRPNLIGSVLFGPGISVLKPLGKFYLGGDLRGQIVPGDGNSGVTIAANGGMRFE